ncbi:ATP-binding cassette domain-containing protein [Cutibacterium sp.]|uniref:ATP-binding cassette domain-containing protein n=1 Tax=Cutibacterium sp. TaxID=1912221 RepID=UPI0026DD6662|nr:ATP-binding cassette domain-containing protein [Cutibacterium sp.]MDO4412234.1 ATP-binding cassette domain-containing protein [Cutibacterium sp.]
MSHTISPRRAETDKAETDTPVIELRDVTMIHRARGGKLFHPTKVVAMDKVNLSVYRGKTLGIVGESGCGKSTTARVMVGLQVPTSGEVLFKGKPLGRHARDRKALGRAVSVVFQDPATALNPRLPIRQVLMDPLNVHDIGTKSDREEAVRDLLGMVGLPSSVMNVLPRQISGGQRQRVAVARALALGPDVIVADEPTSALDVSVRAQILNLFDDLQERLGLGLVFISHDMNTVRHISDRIAVMNSGRILEIADTEEIFNNPKDPYTKKLLSAVPSLLVN